MVYKDKFLQYFEAAFSQNTHLDQEDVISLFAFILQLPHETQMDVNAIAKLIFHILSRLHKSQYLKEFLSLLESCEKNDYVRISSHKMYFQNRFTFQVLLITSLKYMKMNFADCLEDLQAILRRILTYIQLDQTLSLNILKVIQLILKKQADVLTPDISLILVEKMNEVASSPICGFKQSAHIISSSAVRLLPVDYKTQLCDLSNFPVKAVALNDILKFYSKSELFEDDDLHKFNNHILNLFHSNTDNRNASFYYEALVRCFSFEDFVSKLWRFYYDHLRNLEDHSGEFFQSLIKYWIPINVKHYQTQFYHFVRDKSIDFRLKSFILLETKRRGHYDKLKFDLDALMFLKFHATSIDGLNIFCTFHKKHIYPDLFEIDAVKYFIKTYTETGFSDIILKSLRQFFSQIFLISHISTGNNENEHLPIYKDFLIYMWQFCFCNLNFEISAQLLQIVWTVTEASSSLVLNYKVDRENVYSFGENLFYKHLQQVNFWHDTFLDKNFVNYIKSGVSTNISVCPNLVELITKYYISEVYSGDVFNFATLLNRLESSVCVQSSEKIRMYTKWLMCSKRFHKTCYADEIVELCSMFKEKLKSSNDCEDLFICVLILDMFIVIKNYDDELDVAEVIDKSLTYFDRIFKDKNLDLTNAKSAKVLEAFINNIMEYLIESQTYWRCFNRSNKYRMLQIMCTIIQRSNMKRPVSLTAVLIQKFAQLMEENEQDKTLKIQFLDFILNSLYDVPNKLNVKIRRNPETRLVIHALCLADKNLQEIYLDWSVNFMVKILADTNSSDASVTSTLNCLEVLIMDNAVHQLTLKFVPNIFKHCVLLFNKSSWSIRNADLQLLKALIERFLGVSVSSGVRPKTTEDFFVLYPQLLNEFYAALEVPVLKESAIIALLFFSESQLRSNFLSSSKMETSFQRFRRLFFSITLKYSHFFGFLAVKSFTSLTSYCDIPGIFCQVADYAKTNFRAIEKNIFANLIQLLEELYIKYSNSLDNTGLKLIQNSYKSLMLYLKENEGFYFNLFSLKVHSIEHISNMLDFNNIDYRKRIWLNNYLPFLIKEISVDKLCILLESIFVLNLGKVPDFLQHHILSVLIDRLYYENGVVYVSRIIHVLVLALIRLPENNNYLITAYAKTIFFLKDLLGVHEFEISCDLVRQVRTNFHTESLYKLTVYALVLSHCDNYNPEYDEIFIDSSMMRKSIVQVQTKDDSELLCDLALSLKYLYKLTRSCSRPHFFRVIFLLLIDDSACLEMCDFVSYLTSQQCSTVLVSLERFLSPSNLIRCLGDEKLVINLLLQFYEYVDRLNNNNNKKFDTYYVMEEEFSVGLQQLKHLIRQSLCKCIVNR